MEAEKIKQITSFDGKIIKEAAALRNYRAQQEAAKNGGYFINQFANADKAEEFHESMFLGVNFVIKYNF